MVAILAVFIKRTPVTVKTVLKPPNGFPNFSIKKWFPKFLNQKMVSQISQSKKWFPKFLNQKMVSQISQSKNGFPNFSIKKWFPKFLNQKMDSQKMVSQKMVFSKNLVNYMFPNQTSAFSRYPTTDSICFRAIIECITSYDSSVRFKLIVYKVKYSICCFKTLRYLLLTIFVCFFSWFFQMVYCLQISIGISLCCLWHLL